jgi:hypothetical protein
MRIEIDPDLVEEAVRAWVEAGSDVALAREFEADRLACYELPASERDAGFRACFRRWFERLGLEDVLRSAFGERSVIVEGVSVARISAARRNREQGVEMFVGEGERGEPASQARRLHVRIRPAALADGAAALAMLRPELLHVADMLDPSFGYRPHLPSSEAGPTHDRMLLDRYAALWSATVYGRLTLEGRARPGERGRVLARLVEKFPRLAPDAEAHFAAFLDGGRPAHEELVAFVLAPPSTPVLGVPEPGSRCALCGCPTYGFVAAEEADSIGGAIRADFPLWTRQDPLCPQCRDLYAAREPVRRGAGPELG